MKLVWQGGDAYLNNRLVFVIARQRGVWYLERYRQRLDGCIEFAAKEVCSSRQAAHDYAEALAAGWT